MTDENIKPVAYEHTMDNTEGIKGNEPLIVITATKKSPFGKPGIDYSETYPVTSKPLYPESALAQAREEGRQAGLRELEANGDEIALFAYFCNHAKEIIALVEAADKHGCGWKMEDPQSTKPCEICDALAALNEE
jgi:hypothetical protein